MIVNLMSVLEENKMKKKINSHKDLLVWEKSMYLVEQIYTQTKNYPKEEIYGITSQMRRSATSIPANITEGFHRNHLKEYIQFLYISKSSAAELETFLEISKRLKFINKDIFNQLNQLTSEILRMLSGLISRLKSE